MGSPNVQNGTHFHNDFRILWSSYGHPFPRSGAPSGLIPTVRITETRNKYKTLEIIWFCAWSIVQFRCVASRWILTGDGLCKGVMKDVLIWGKKRGVKKVGRENRGSTGSKDICVRFSRKSSTTESDYFVVEVVGRLRAIVRHDIYLYSFRCLFSHEGTIRIIIVLANKNNINL